MTSSLSLTTPMAFCRRRPTLAVTNFTANSAFSSRSSPDLDNCDSHNSFSLPMSWHDGTQLASQSQAEENLFLHTPFSQKLLAPQLHSPANIFTPKLWYRLLMMFIMIHDSHMPFRTQ